MVVENDLPCSSETSTTPTKTSNNTTPLLKEKLASSLVHFRNKRPTTPNRKVAIIEKYNSSTAGTGPAQSAPVQAYAKLAGANWTFYIQSLAITLGRTSDQDESSEKEKERKRHDSKLSTDDSEQLVVPPPVTTNNEDVDQSVPPAASEPTNQVLDSETKTVITTITPAIVKGQTLPPTPSSSSEPSKEGPLPPACASDVIDVDLGPAKVVSRKHARVEFNFYTRKWDLHVLGRNGLKVNEMVFKPECSPIQLESGMLLEVGGVQFTFILPDGYTANSTPDGSCTPIEEGLMPPPNNRSRPRNRRVSLDDGMLDHASFDYRSDAARMIKPPYSYATLIAQAINSVPSKRLTLAGIYLYISENYAFYRHSPTGWQNSIRHNLSLNKAFQKVPRGANEPGKGMLWLINSECRTSFEDGTARRRRPSAGSRRSSPSTPRHGSDLEGEQRHSEKPLRRQRRSRAASDEEIEDDDSVLYRNRQRTSSYLIPSNPSSAHSSNPSSPSPRLTKRLRACSTSAAGPLRTHSYNEHYSTPASPSSSAYLHMLPSAFPISPSSSQRFRPLRSSLSKFPSSPPWSEASSSSSTTSSPISSPSSLDPPLIPCTPASLMSSMPHAFLDLKIVDFLPPVNLTGKFPLPIPPPGSTPLSISGISSANSSSSSSPTAVGKQSQASQASHTHHSHHHIHHPHLAHLIPLAPAGTPRRIQPHPLPPPSSSSCAGAPMASQTKTPAASPPPPTSQRPPITCDFTKLAPRSSLPSLHQPSLSSHHTQLSLQSSHNHNNQPSHHHYQHIQPQPAPFAIHPYPGMHAHPPPHAMHHPHMALMYGPPLQRNLGNPMLAVNMGMNMGGLGMMANPGGNIGNGSGLQTGKMKLQAKLQAKVAAKAAAAMAASEGPGNSTSLTGTLQSVSENEQIVGFDFGSALLPSCSSTTVSSASTLSLPSPAKTIIPSSPSSVSTSDIPYTVPVPIAPRHTALVPNQAKREQPAFNLESGNAVTSGSDMVFVNPNLTTCEPLDVSKVQTQREWNQGESVPLTFDSSRPKNPEQEKLGKGGLVGLDHTVSSAPDPTYLNTSNENGRGHLGKKECEDATRGSEMDFEMDGDIGMELEYNRDRISKGSWTREMDLERGVRQDVESDDVEMKMRPDGVEQRGRNGTESMDLDDIRETSEGMVGMDVGNGREVLR